jgi:integrase
MRAKLTDTAIRKLKPTGQRYEVWDASRPGFGVRMGQGGKRSFVFLYHAASTARRMTLGQYPKMSLADAGVAYAEARRQLELGFDPGATEVAKRRQARATPTVRELGEEYLEKHCKPNKRSWLNDTRVLEHDVFPIWGTRKITAIRRSDVNDLIDDIATRAPIQSNRTFALIRAMFKFAEGRDYIPVSPCHGVKARTKERSRDRALEMPEVATLWRGIDEPGISATLRLAIRFLLLTGQRIGEVVNAEWSEMDIASATWTLPGVKVKNGKPHRVPLSSQALGILEEAKSIKEEIERRRERPRKRDAAKWNADNKRVRWVFASPRGDKPITTRCIDRALRRLRTDGKVPDFRPHDLRRTAASHMTRLGSDRLTVHKLLNHSDRSVTAIYDRYDYDAPKRQAVDAWGAEVEQTIHGAELQGSTVNLTARPATRLSGVTPIFPRQLASTAKAA